MNTLKAALLGKELGHSISDVLHRELFKIIAPKFSANTISLDYSLIECTDEVEFEDWITNAKSDGYTGVNVTYPYKNDLARLSEKILGAAEAINSANSVAFTGTEKICASTDGVGFVNALLREYPDVDLNPYHLIVIGDGEAAKAVLYALCTKWMPLSLTIASRNTAHAAALAEFCLSKAQGPSIDITSIDDINVHVPQSRHRFVIQATPVGQMNHAGNLLDGFTWSDLDFAADLVYNPIETEFLSHASQAGAKNMGGLGMLIEQAALSQAFWLTGEVKEISPLTTDEYLSVRSFCEAIINSNAKD